jgi:hypothetical protein
MVHPYIFFRHRLLKRNSPLGNGSETRKDDQEFDLRSIDGLAFNKGEIGSEHARFAMALFGALTGRIFCRGAFE